MGLIMSMYSSIAVVLLQGFCPFYPSVRLDDLLQQQNLLVQNDNPCK